MSTTPDAEQIICVTGQHREMLDQVLSVFDIVPHYDLNIMKPGQDLDYVTCSVLQGVSKVLKKERPDWLLVQGDTTTAFAAALAGFYEGVPVAHIEAGLRTHNPMSPWPEEVNRRLVATLATLHFAPTPLAANNLLLENIPQNKIFITGNTVIDALKWTSSRPESEMAINLILSKYAPKLIKSSKRLVLVTLHRRENLGEKLKSICQGLKMLAERTDIEIVFPMHMNPAVQLVVKDVLGKHKHVHCLPPLDYLPFVALLGRSYIVVTDSGGIQEEAPGLGKPVLVARDTTERPEAVNEGTAMLIGTKAMDIYSNCNFLLDNDESYLQMVGKSNPFGDGHSSRRIIKLLQKNLNLSKKII